MPSKSNTQLQFFKFVKKYKKNGLSAISFLPSQFQDRIIKTANKISDKDLRDMLKMDGDESSAEEGIMNPRVGWWATIKPNIKSDSGRDIAPFLSQIKYVNNKDNKINFNSDFVYGLDGEKRVPVKYNGQTLDFAPFSWIVSVSRDKPELIKEDCELRALVRECLLGIFR